MESAQASGARWASARPQGLQRGEATGAAVGRRPGRWRGGRQGGRGADAGRRQQGQAEAGAARGQRGRVATHGRGATASERVRVRSTATARTGKEGEARGCSRRRRVSVCAWKRGGESSQGGRRVRVSGLGEEDGEGAASGSPGTSAARRRGRWRVGGVLKQWWSATGPPGGCGIEAVSAGALPIQSARGREGGSPRRGPWATTAGVGDRRGGEAAPGGVGEGGVGECEIGRASCRERV